MKLIFTAYGRPEPQGSIRAFTPKGWRRPVLTSDNPKLKKWREKVQNAALVGMDLAKFKKIEKGATVNVKATFYLCQPASAGKRPDPTVKPDLDKLCRAVLDALTGVAYADDGQICGLDLTKEYGNPERAEVEVETE